MLRPLHAQSRFLTILGASWFAVFFLTRSLLLAVHFDEFGLPIAAVAKAFAAGMLYDLVFLVYALLPLASLLALCPPAWWQRRWFQRGLHGLVGLSLFVMLFCALAEWLFWNEFGVRFNFIAVDYLVYSKEVIANIRESYPVAALLAIVALCAAALAYGLRSTLQRAFAAAAMTRKGAMQGVAAFAALAFLCANLITQDSFRDQGDNSYQRELAGNGPYQFFAAFRNNELDYRQFYATLPAIEVGEQLRSEVSAANARFVDSDPQDIRRWVDNPGEARRLNVIVVTIESLSARYLGSFGDSRGLTPVLDRLRQDSWTFTRFYATGTRTDRGLEAITLSIPPTPGRSIVKRIGRESGYASLGQQFAAQGYDSVFIYGGRGYFDNMNAFFSGNGYRIIDQSSVADEEIGFTNAWGMADEDLYRQALKVADADHGEGRPFFLQLMTTSNHRPYTYPDGRIDIPSGSGREGAVKYSDYAIGQFLDQARTRPWFADTVFVFVADHTAGSAGREDLPLANYHIPLFIYSPRHVAPGEFTEVASQIDLAPTLLGLLNFDYESTFFGHNLLDPGRPSGRALIGNYQHLGLFDGKDLAILSPRRALRRHDDADGNSHESTAAASDYLLRRCIAYYQGASHAFGSGLLAWRQSAGARGRSSFAAHP